MRQPPAGYGPFHNSDDFGPDPEEEDFLHTPVLPADTVEELRDDRFRVENLDVPLPVPDEIQKLQEEEAMTTPPMPPQREIDYYKTGFFAVLAIGLLLMAQTIGWYNKYNDLRIENAILKATCKK